MSERQHHSDPSEVPFSPFIDEVERTQVQMEFDLQGPVTDPYDAETGIHNVADSAAHNQPYHHQLQMNIAIGVPDPKHQEQLRLALDGNTAAMRSAYTAPAEGGPAYNPSFIDLVDNATDAAARPSIKGKDKWEATPDMIARGELGTKESLANRIRDALNADPSQIGVLLARLKTLEDNAINANKAVLEAQAKADELAHPLAVAQRQQREANPAAGDPRTDDVLTPPNGVDAIRTMPAGFTSPNPKTTDIEAWMNIERKRLHDGVKRFMPGAARRHAEIDGYVGTYTSRVTSLGLNVANIDRARDEILTGNGGSAPGMHKIGKGLTTLGVEARKTISGADARKFKRFLEIVEGIDELNPDYDPDVIVAKHTDLERLNRETYEVEIDPAKVEAYKNNIDDKMAEWRRTGSAEDDHASFASVHRARNYMDDVREALDGMSEYNPRYPRLFALHGELVQIYNVAAYQQMRQRKENAIATGHSFNGRIEIEFMEDMGLVQEDGNDNVLYPDGSTATLAAPGLAIDRLNADGTPWVAPAAPSTTRLDGIRASVSDLFAAKNLSRLEQQILYASDAYFIDPSEENRIKTWALCEAAQEVAEAQIASGQASAAAAGVRYIEDVRLRETINSCRYNALYHDMKPGEAPNAGEPRILSNGLIQVENTELYGTTGTWVLYPNGATERIDHYGIAAEGFNPNGSRAF